MAVGSSDIASTALSPSYSAGFLWHCINGAGSLLRCADGAGPLLHRADGAGPLHHRADSAGPLLHRADSDGSLLHHAERAGSLLHCCVPPTLTVLHVLFVVSCSAAMHLCIIADRSTWQLVHIRGLCPTRHQWSMNYSPTPPPQVQQQMEQNAHWETATLPWLEKDQATSRWTPGRISLMLMIHIYRTLLLLSLKCVRLFMLILCISFNIIAFLVAWWLAVASSIFSVYWVFLFHFPFTVPETDKIIMSEEEIENTISTETLMK